jgi:hypothetical protein
MATIEVINVGAAANDGDGDPLRTAFQKVNNNFANINSIGFSTAQEITVGVSPQLLLSTPVYYFTQATMQINSSNLLNDDSQNIVIYSAINNGLTDVNWTGQFSQYFGNLVTNFDMIVENGNVNLYALPLGNAANTTISHFISYQITYNYIASGSIIALSQDTNSELVTETGLLITT